MAMHRLWYILLKQLVFKLFDLFLSLVGKK